MRNFRRLVGFAQQHSASWDSAALIRKSKGLISSSNSQRLFVALGLFFLVASVGAAMLPLTAHAPKESTNSSQRQMPAARMPIPIDDAAPAAYSQEFSLRAGYRAVALGVDARAGVEGYAQPGSHVDVYYTFVDETGRLKSTILAENARVLSARGQLFEAPFQRAAQKQLAYGSVILEVLPEESMKILTGSKVALLSLVLRSPSDKEKAAPSTTTSEDVAPLPSIPDEPSPVQRAYCPSMPGSRVKIGTPLLPSGYEIPPVGASLFHQCRPLSVL